MDLNDYLLLYSIKNDLDWANSLKLDSGDRLRKLVRRGFLEEDWKTLTQMGEKLLEGSIQEEPDQKVRKKPAETGGFEEFWLTFPSNDKYAHHIQTRVLRSDRLRTKQLYDALIERKEVTHEKLLLALKKDIEMRQRASLGKENKFTYMPAITAWLNKKYYESYLEEEIKDTKTPKYGEDIQ